MKPILFTDRLILKFLVMNDLEAVHALHSLPETDRYNTLGIPANVEETKTIIETWAADNLKKDNKNFTFTIEEKESKKFIGLIALKLANKKFQSGEVWYKLNSNFWGNGYATESLNGILRFGFEQLKLHRIEAGCAVENIASIKVLEKVGMTKEGRKRKVLPLKSGWSDNFEYAILETDPRMNRPYIKS